MHNPYFSDREQGPRPRTVEEISEPAWGGIIALIRARVTDGSFGFGYPQECPDGRGTSGCDENSLFLALRGEVPEIPLPLRPDKLPPGLAILDLLEFCHRAVARPVQINYHAFYGHHHLEFGREEGQVVFREDVNRILARNGLAYQLGPDGLVVRLAPAALQEALAATVFRTGDAELDALLESARKKYLDPDPTVRREALEKLWDAWERLKTIEPGKGKKASATALLDRASAEPSFRGMFEEEALRVTAIGNTFRIRHSETTQVPLALNEHVDYLFHRLFALIRLLLRTTGRGG